MTELKHVDAADILKEARVAHQAVDLWYRNDKSVSLPHLLRAVRLFGLNPAGSPNYHNYGVFNYLLGGPFNYRDKT